MSNDTNLPESSAPTWHNWSENLVHEPPTNGAPYYFAPKNRAALQGVISQAVAAGMKLRVSGQRHSQPPLVTDDNRNAVPEKPTEWLIDMSCYADLGSDGTEQMVMDGSNKVIVNAGVREDALDAFLTQRNLILNTVTAGGFFSIGGMTAVDVHGATIAAPIFAETASAFTIMGPDGQVTTIDATTPAEGGHSPLEFVRVSLGSLGVVTSITIDVLDRPYANTLVPSRQIFDPPYRPQKSLETVFAEHFVTILAQHERVESFFNPYADHILTNSFMALCWDLKPPEQGISNQEDHPDSACKLAGEDEYGAKLLDPALEYLGQKAALAAQESNNLLLPYTINGAAMKNIQNQVDTANAKYSDLWLGEAARVIFMSYFISMPDLSEASLRAVWPGMQVVYDYVQVSSNFHTAAPMEFRFIKAGNSALSGTFSTNPDSYFINLDLIGFTHEGKSAAEYSPELLQFFATVERKWVELGGMPHNGKMYGFYDPNDANTESYTAPFNSNFVSLTTERRKRNGAPVDAFKAYRQSRDPGDVFYNQYLRAMLG